MIAVVVLLIMMIIGAIVAAIALTGGFDDSDGSTAGDLVPATMTLTP